MRPMNAVPAILCPGFCVWLLCCPVSCALVDPVVDRRLVCMAVLSLKVEAIVNVSFSRELVLPGSV